ncbi:hypothetical protein LCGC14_0810410 [marine sediment metagenome]|uniref:OmpR/PhoB-type domain-containing protein n=1 Tax=marine sediment metagenome TaxID=412755 RepID=A0A0F9Q721_9ZZZZ
MTHTPNETSSVALTATPDDKAIPLELNVSTGILKQGEVVCSLTPTEARFLGFLATRSDRSATHGSILRQVWGADYTREIEYVRAYVYRLNKKLREAFTLETASPITNLPSVGYRLELEIQVSQLQYYPSLLTEVLRLVKKIADFGEATGLDVQEARRIIHEVRKNNIADLQSDEP